jgi:hypothetical protein
VKAIMQVTFVMYFQLSNLSRNYGRRIRTFQSYLCQRNVANLCYEIVIIGDHIKTCRFKVNLALLFLSGLKRLYFSHVINCCKTVKDVAP